MCITSPMIRCATITCDNLVAPDQVICGACERKMRFQDIEKSATEYIRTFDSGAIRSAIGNKFHYEGFINPMCTHRFAAYMHQHRKQANGAIRDADNWQKGIPPASLIDSAERHMMDWKLFHRGYNDLMTEDIEDSLCALIFNANAYLLYLLNEKRKGT